MVVLGGRALSYERGAPVGVLHPETAHAVCSVFLTWMGLKVRARVWSVNFSRQLTFADMDGWGVQVWSRFKTNVTSFATKVSLPSSSSLLLPRPELSDTKSMSLKYEPASEPLHTSVQ